MQSSFIAGQKGFGFDQGRAEIVPAAVELARDSRRPMRAVTNQAGLPGLAARRIVFRLPGSTLWIAPAATS